MNHRIKGRRLNRNSAHRKALMRNLAIALIEHEFIKTTLPKAKELRPYVEKIITLAKVDTLANRRHAISVLGNQEIIDKLFTVVGKNAISRNGGYTRIMKYGFRTGDKAPMAIIEVVDRKIVEDETKDSSAKKSKKPAVKTIKQEAVA